MRALRLRPACWPLLSARGAAQERPTVLRDVGFDQRLDELVPARHRRCATRRAGTCGSATTSGEAGGADARLLRVPDAVHPDAERPGQRHRTRSLRRRPGVRGRDGQLRAARDAGARRAPRRRRTSALPAPGRGGGLALPDRRTGRDRAAHPGRRLPLHLGRARRASTRTQPASWCSRPRAASRATCSASSTRPRTCGSPWSRPRGPDGRRWSTRPSSTATSTTP